MKHILLLILALGTLAGHTQDSKYRLFEFYEGYIVKDDGTKERGYIQHLDESDRYEKVVFKTDPKAKKQKFKVGQIAGYKVADTEYRGVEYADVMFKGRKFLIIDELGCINTYHFRQYNATDRTWETITIFENDEGAINSQKFLLSFAKSMADLVKADPELAEKVLNKEKGYGLLNMYNIVSEYNANCKAKK